MNREFVGGKKSWTYLLILIFLSLSIIQSEGINAQEDILPEFAISVDHSNPTIEIIPNTNTLHTINGTVMLSYQWKEYDSDLIVEIDIDADSWQAETQPTLIFQKGDHIKDFTYNVSIPGDLRYSLNEMVLYGYKIEFSGTWKRSDSILSRDIPSNPNSTYFFHINHYYDINIDNKSYEIVVNNNEQKIIEFTIWNTGNGYDTFLIDPSDLEEKINGLDVQIYRENDISSYDVYPFQYNQSFAMKAVFNFTDPLIDTQESLGFINISSTGSLNELGIPIYKHIEVKVRMENQLDDDDTNDDKNALVMIFWISIVIIIIISLVIIIILIRRERNTLKKNEEKKE